MFPLDPDNHSKDYVDDHNRGFLDIFPDDYDIYFYDHYERKLDSFENQIECLCSKRFGVEKHPNETLKLFDKAEQFLKSKIYNFFQDKAQYYGESIWSYYDDYQTVIEDERKAYRAYEYNDDLAAHYSFLLEKEKSALIKKGLLKLLKSKTLVKRADFFKSFTDKEDIRVAKIVIKELIGKEKIEIVRKDGKTTGPIYFMLKVKDNNSLSKF